MAKVKVWNKNVHPHKEQFKGETIEIPAGGYIEMEYYDAKQFQSQWTPMAPKECLPEERSKYFKKIVVEKPAVVAEDPNAALVCHADGKIAASKEELQAKLLQFADRIVKDDELDKKKAAPSEEIDALKAQVAALQAAIEKMGQKNPVGRPKKAQAASA